MKKVFSLFAAALIIVLAATGCTEAPAEKTDKTAAELLDIVLNSVEFPEMVELTDETRITGELGIDLELVEEYAIVQQMLSVDVAEIIIIKVKDGSLDAVKSQLQARKQALIDTYAYYPEQVASAQAAVTGSKNDIAYLICHVEAASAEEKLRSEI